MLKYLMAILFFTATLVACHSNDHSVTQVDSGTQVKEEKAVAPPVQKILGDSIIPAKRIGHVEIGMTTEQLAQTMGKPDMEEAAMGKAWLLWTGKPDEHNNTTELNVYTEYEDTSMKRKTVKMIRTNSASFHTSEGINVYDSLHEIGKVYQGLVYRGHFSQDTSGKIISIYDMPARGIAFEISVIDEHKRCTAIIVYQPTKGFMNMYTGFLNARGWQAMNQASTKMDSKGR